MSWPVVSPGKRPRSATRSADWWSASPAEADATGEADASDGRARYGRRQFASRRPCPRGSRLSVATTSGGLPLLDLRLMARAGRAREGPRRHVRPARFRASGARRLDARREGLGDGWREAADPRRLDLANPLALLDAPLALPLGVFRHPFLS